MPARPARGRLALLLLAAVSAAVACSCAGPGPVRGPARHTPPSPPAARTVPAQLRLTRSQGSPAPAGPARSRPG